MSKYNPGDKIHVEFEVVGLNKVNPDMLDVRRRLFVGGKVIVDFANSCIPQDHPAIVKHVPKPYEPRIGDIVKWRTTLAVFRIVAIDDNQAWLRYAETERDSRNLGVVLLSDLRPFTS